MAHEQSLHSLQHALTALEQKKISIAEFCNVWRAQQALLAELPPRYGEVMEDLLGRLEAGSLFTEESCSFSQHDLQATLAVWLDKAGQQLQKA